MSMNSQIDLSKICGRKLSDEEAARIRGMASNLELRDDDAIWQLLAAIEYQKTYYENIPKRIENASNKLLENVQQAAEKEVEKSQAILAKSVVKHAHELTLSMKLEVITPLVLVGIIIQFCYGVMMIWAGISMMDNGFYPLLTIFRLEIGPVLMGMLFVLGALFTVIVVCTLIDEKYKWDKKGNFKFAINFFLGSICFGLSVLIYSKMF